MNLRELYFGRNENNSGRLEQKTPVISFEIFPPKNDSDGSKLDKLISHLKLLNKYNPAFISLTYGAGGTTQNSSINIIERIQKEVGAVVMPHFTCVGSSRAQVKNYLKEIQNFGIKNILALRGDIPEGMEQVHFDFNYANELVSFIKSETSLSIGVAGYPECHIDCDDLGIDLKNLKKKVDAGADAVYTQMFFDNDKFFSFVESARNIGIDVPILPGILPIMNFSQLERMLSMARVSVPQKLMIELEKYKDNPEDVKKVGIEFASFQCKQLIESGTPGLHFFTLNTSSSVNSILDNLNINTLSQPRG